MHFITTCLSNTKLSEWGTKTPHSCRVNLHKHAAAKYERRWEIEGLKTQGNHSGRLYRTSKSCQDAEMGTLQRIILQCGRRGVLSLPQRNIMWTVWKTSEVTMAMCPFVRLTLRCCHIISNPLHPRNEFTVITTPGQHCVFITDWAINKRQRSHCADDKLLITKYSSAGRDRSVNNIKINRVFYLNCKIELNSLQ